MASEPEVKNEKPEGFSKWIGRIIGAVLIATALGIAFYNFSDNSNDSSPVPAEENQGIKLQ